MNEASQLNVNTIQKNSLLPHLTASLINLAPVNVMVTEEEATLSPITIREQLQLHVQTIGILVAEKAELQSKFQQSIKKCDKKQDECDELMGKSLLTKLKKTK
jgi:hypothetical protein